MLVGSLLLLISLGGFADEWGVPDAFWELIGADSDYIKKLVDRIHQGKVDVYSDGMYKAIEILPKQDLRILRNYYFAEHSKIFKSNDLTEFFNKTSWYKPVLAEVVLSGKEKEFMDKVAAIETGRGLKYQDFLKLFAIRKTPFEFKSNSDSDPFKAKTTLPIPIPMLRKYLGQEVEAWREHPVSLGNIYTDNNLTVLLYGVWTAAGGIDQHYWLATLDANGKPLDSKKILWEGGDLSNYSTGKVMVGSDLKIVLNIDYLKGEYKEVSKLEYKISNTGKISEHVLSQVKLPRPEE